MGSVFILITKRVRLRNIHPGRHSIEVYSMNRNVRGNKSPVYASSFIVKPRYDVFIQMDYNGYVHISESRGLDDNIMNQKGKHGHYKNKNNNGRYGSSEYNNYSFEDDDRYSIYSNDKWRDGRREAINDYAFENIIESINEQWFNKQNVALDAVVRNYFTTRQIKIMLRQFYADDDKLQIAKMAYSNTIDPQNFYQLYNVFTYENSRDALDQFVRSYR